MNIKPIRLDVECCFAPVTFDSLLLSYYGVEIGNTLYLTDRDNRNYYIVSTNDLFHYDPTDDLHSMTIRTKLIPTTIDDANILHAIANAYAEMSVKYPCR